ncbi:MAG: response regulator [Candidatus Cloacimonetes bacterium]|nr:response regulator [Candidatus Cloacimonadota bacterium]
MNFTIFVIRLAEALLSAPPGETSSTLHSALETLASAIDMERAGIHLENEGGDFVRDPELCCGDELAIPRVFKKEWLQDDVFAPILEGTPVLLANLGNDGAEDSLPARLADHGVRTLFLLPLRREQHVVGLLCLERSTAISRWDNLDSPGLALLSGVISAAIERIRSEERLSSLEAGYRELFNSVSDPIYIQDAQGRFVDVNMGAVRIYGYPREYFLGKTPEFISAPGRNDMNSVIQHVMAALNGEFRRFEFWGIDSSGRVFPKEVSLYPGRYNGGPAIFAFATIISERKSREEALRIEDERSLHARKLESLGVLAGGIAHDFNNLLQTIMGNAELAADEQMAGSASALYLRDVIQASNHAADLCRQMLAYSGKGQFQLGIVDLGAEVHTIARILESARKPGTRLLLDLDSEPVVIHADVAQVRQVLMNLLTNAMEALGEDPGEVRIRTWNQVLDPAELENVYFAAEAQPGRFACLEVGDTGSGMDEDTLGRLFDPFFTTKILGRGLGLSAVLGIMRSHGGMIRVQSQPDRGTRFQVMFPAHGQASPHMLPPQRISRSNSNELRVLLADDQAATRRICKRQLERQGHHVEDAEDGAQAWALFQKDPASWSLILLDLGMPGLSGDQVLRRIHAIRPELPAILMSGYDEEDAVSKIGDDPRTRFLQKPFTGAQLAGCIATLFEPR